MPNLHMIQYTTAASICVATFSIIIILNHFAKFFLCYLICSLNKTAAVAVADALLKKAGTWTL
jgi:hypothetical protein